MTWVGNSGRTKRCVTSKATDKHRAILFGFVSALVCIVNEITFIPAFTRSFGVESAFFHVIILAFCIITTAFEIFVARRSLLPSGGSSAGRLFDCDVVENRFSLLRRSRCNSPIRGWRESARVWLTAIFLIVLSEHRTFLAFVPMSISFVSSRGLSPVFLTTIAMTAIGRLGTSRGDRGRERPLGTIRAFRASGAP